MADRIRVAVERALQSEPIRWTLSQGPGPNDMFDITVEAVVSNLTEAEITEGSCIPSLHLRHTEDGTWLEFTASNGQQAAVNLSVYANERGGVVGSAIRQWCEDRRAEDATG